MKYLFAPVFVYCLRFLYFFIKAFTKSKNKIVYLSRQSGEKSLDMRLLEKEIEKRNHKARQVFRLRTLSGGPVSAVRYLFGLIGDMYHIATASVAVCDTYSLAVSCLNHKKGLTVIQMWHAMGAIKKFGLQSVGFSEGRDESLSRALNMHKNYDFVISPSRATAEFYKEAFGIEDEKIKICSLPHIDFILDGQSKKETFYAEYPNAKGKKIVLYLPTFRENESGIVKGLKEAFEAQEDIEFLVSLHPLSKIAERKEYEIKGGFTTFELLKMADCVITDYSACAFEAALLDIPLFFYVPDYDGYLQNRGLNIELSKEMPKCTFKDANALIRSIKTGEYDKEDLHIFREKYIEKTKDCAGELANFVLSMTNQGGK